MKCPYCGKDMDLGYIQCRDGVYWCQKKRAVAALPLFGGESISLSPSSNHIFGGAYAEAYHCKKCKKILIEYSV